MVAEQPIGKILDKICLCFVKLSPLHLQWMKLKAFANCDDCLQVFDEEILVLVSNHPSVVYWKIPGVTPKYGGWRILYIYIYIYYILSLNTFSIIMRERVWVVQRAAKHIEIHMFCGYTSGRQACNSQWTQMGENQNAQNHHPESMLNLNSTSLILTKKKQRLIPCVQVCFENQHQHKMATKIKWCLRTHCVNKNSPTTQCVALDPSSSVPAP